ncbi:MAG TPA: hypothetical protein VGR87_10775 [Candidatus Limnocylindria bacterium]|nr:hypothetical protein [Candidatus Limnocylindria bacterium]
MTGAPKAPNLTFEGRYSDELVRAGIATFPATFLRWQKDLNVSDGAALTALSIFSFYIEGARWPSVSKRRLAGWRGVSRDQIENEMRELETLGFLTRTSKDPKWGSYYCDLSGLLTRLRVAADAERRIKSLRVEEGAIRAEVATAALEERH